METQAMKPQPVRSNAHGREVWTWTLEGRNVSIAWPVEERKIGRFAHMGCPAGPVERSEVLEHVTSCPWHVENIAGTWYWVRH